MKPKHKQFLTVLEHKTDRASKDLKTVKFEPRVQQSSLAKVKPRLVGGKFGKSGRGNLFNFPQTPGPGRYSRTVKSAGPFFLFTSKKSEKSLITPGPGSYTPRVTENNSVIKIGKAHRSDYMKIQNTPGPGQYETTISKSSNGWTFTQSKDSSFFSQNPGPGQYNPLDLNNSTGGASFRAKRTDLFLCISSPGPADYFKSHTDRGGGFSFTKAQKLAAKIGSPGPAWYNPEKLSHSSSAVFGTSSRVLEWKTDAPGANAYHPNKAPGSPSYSFGLKVVKTCKTLGPGPAGYSPEKLADRVNCKIGKSLRFIKNKEAKPGPGQYNLSREIADGKFYCSKSKKSSDSKLKTPGPGQYNV